MTPRVAKLEDVIRERAKRNLITQTKQGYQELGKAEKVHTNKELGKIVFQDWKAKLLVKKDQ